MNKQPAADKISEAEMNRLTQRLEAVKAEISRVVVGQRSLLDLVLTGLLADGHMLLEGLPGLAKTLLFRTLAQVIGAQFRRIQFTPDLLPADVTGTSVYNAREGTFSVKRGPVFANLLLADEINRAPAKVQSALLEAMEERQVTIGEQTYPLPSPFLVLATQNPLDQQGTYPLPEAQIDRFMMKLRVDFPSRAEEAEIIERMTASVLPQADTLLKAEELLAWRSLLPRVYMDETVRGYVLDLVFATRQPGEFGLGDLKPYIAHGASPRASLALIKTARAYALLQKRTYVIPDDVKAVAYAVLRHRLAPSYEAQAEDVGSEELIRRILAEVRVP